MLDHVAMHKAIMAIETNEEISAVYKMLKAARANLQEKASLHVRRTMRAGDRVKLGMSVRPEYMQGAIGTIKRINTTTVVVDFDSPQGRFHRGVRVPVGMVDVLLEGDGGR